MRNSFVTFILSFALLVTSNHVCLAQTASSAQSKQAQAAEKMKRKVEKIGVGNTITVNRIDKRTFYGKVSKLDTDGFEIVETDSQQAVSFRYIDLKEIRKGDGERNLITGKRVHPKRGWLWGVVIFGVLFTVLGVALSDKDF